MSLHHADAYREAGVSVVGGADISEDALRRFRRHAGIDATYTDYEQMLDETRPALVSVVTPHELHCRMVLAAAARCVQGIICEKPMAVDLPEACRMVDACRTSGSKLIVNHQRCYEAPYVRAYELISEGAIGRVRSAEAHSTSCSVLGDGTHVLHMLLFLLGRPHVRRLLAQVQRSCTDGSHCEDGGIAFIVFDDDLYAHFAWGLASREPRQFLHVRQRRLYYQSLVIHGETGRLEVGSDGPTEQPAYLRVQSGGARQEFRYPDADEPYSKVDTQRASIVHAIADLIRSIERGFPHPLDADSAREVTEVIEGIYQSCRERKAVTFPLHDSG